MRTLRRGILPGGAGDLRGARAASNPVRTRRSAEPSRAVPAAAADRAVEARIAGLLREERRLLSEGERLTNWRRRARCKERAVNSRSPSTGGATAIASWGWSSSPSSRPSPRSSRHPMTWRLGRSRACITGRRVCRPTPRPASHEPSGMSSSRWLVCPSSCAASRPPHAGTLAGEHRPPVLAAASSASSRPVRASSGLCGSPPRRTVSIALSSRVRFVS